MKKTTIKKWLYALIGITFFIVFFYVQNNSIVISEYTIVSEKIPQNFSGYKIVQLSDLHNKSFGKDQNKLVEKVKKVEPDLIVFTGDLIDSRRYDENPSLVFMQKLVQVAPIYYVTGNHEGRSGKFHSLEEQLTKLGVHVLRNTSKEINEGTEKIQILGIDDPTMEMDLYTEPAETEKNIKESMKETEEENFSILLAHRPEMFSLYSEYNLDIVFSGHAHGGQFRIPFVGGFIAPNQGFFPKYTSGKHVLGNTIMVVNRGLGNSIIPIRIFNRPEIVVVNLRTEDR